MVQVLEIVSFFFIVKNGYHGISQNLFFFKQTVRNILHYRSMISQNHDFSLEGGVEERQLHYPAT